MPSDPPILPIRFRCPHCAGKLSATADQAGAIVQCPHCAAPTFVPPTIPAAPNGMPVAAAAFVAVELKLRCPACQAKLRVDSRAAGRRCPCPECGGALAIPLLPPYPARLTAEAEARDTRIVRAVQAPDFSLTAEEIDFLMAPVAVTDEPDERESISA